MASSYFCRVPSTSFQSSSLMRFASGLDRSTPGPFSPGSPPLSLSANLLPFDCYQSHHSTAGFRANCSTYSSLGGQLNARIFLNQCATVFGALLIRDVGRWVVWIHNRSTSLATSSSSPAVSGLWMGGRRPGVQGQRASRRVAREPGFQSTATGRADQAIERAA